MWAVIQKINDKFMAKEYVVKLAEIFLVSTKKGNVTSEIYTEKDAAHTNDDQNSTPDNLINLKSKRQAAKHALDRICETKYVSTPSCNRQANNTTLEAVSTHIWNHDDWIALCETDDNFQERDELRTPQPPGTGNNTDINSFLLLQHLILTPY